MTNEIYKTKMTKIYTPNMSTEIIQDYYYIQGNKFVRMRRLLHCADVANFFFLMWFWRMVVAMPNTEKENNGPHQSPQLG